MVTVTVVELKCDIDCMYWYWSFILSWPL